MRTVIKDIVFEAKHGRMLVCGEANGQSLSFIGGEAYEDEIGFDAAYRVIYDTFGIQADDIILKPLCTVTDRLTDTATDVWFGVLECDYGIAVSDSVPVWLSSDEEISHSRFNEGYLAAYIADMARKYAFSEENDR